jgi:anti-sigma regulatory factor (Ser/Thr protein kinase)
LIANAVRHAPGLVIARCRVCPGGAATIEIDDAGSGFVPSTVPADLFAESGRGLALLRRLTDGVVVGSAPGGGASVRVHLNGPRAAAS